MIVGANNTISTKRLSEASNKESFPVGFQLQGVDCYIESLRPEIATIMDDTAGFTTYNCHVDGVTDFKVGDKVIDKDSNVYIIQNVAKFVDNPEFGDYVEISMVKKYDAN